MFDVMWEYLLSFKDFLVSPSCLNQVFYLIIKVIFGFVLICVSALFDRNCSSPSSSNSNFSNSGDGDSDKSWRDDVPEQIFSVAVLIYSFALFFCFNDCVEQIEEKIKHQNDANKDHLQKVNCDPKSLPKPPESIMRSKPGSVQVFSLSSDGQLILLGQYKYKLW